MKTDKHHELISRGCALHEARKYAKALAVFEKAVALSPNCPIGLYNLANTLYMLDCCEQAHDILLELVDTPETDLNASCPKMRTSARSLHLDAFYILFLTTLHGTESWREAVPYLRRHMRRRSRGLQSLWTKSEVVREADRLRTRFAPRTKAVKSWAH